MLTIIYLEGRPVAAVRFKSGAAELISSTNMAMSDATVTLTRANKSQSYIIGQVKWEQAGNPAIEKFFNDQEDIPTDEQHHRIDENGLTPLPLQVGGEEILEP